MSKIDEHRHKSKNHFNTTHGESHQTKEWAVWTHIRQRCYNKKSEFYQDYGGRGITVCDRWLATYQNFLNDMGRAPSKRHTLERTNNDLGYSPDNCRWATMKEQCNNRRSNVRITIEGVTKTATQWAEMNGIRPKMIMKRIKSGWSPVDAVLKPRKKQRTF